ncbi:cytochrome c biogenesis protein ResB [Porphyromonadaceae bacterium]
MHTTTKHRMWQSPWSYPESIAFVGGIAMVGFALQSTVGKFDFRLLEWPINIITGIVLILLIIASGFNRGNTIIRWFSGTHMSVVLIASLVLLGIIMGLTPQIFLGATPQNGIPHHLGFDNMTSSWSFVMIYFLLLLSLGILIARRLSTFKWLDYAFYLNHIGLWLTLFAAGLGAADMKRYVMHIYEGETEWRVYNENKDILDLPVAIQLNDFYMEEYPPKLALINRSSGAILPEGTPEFFQIDTKIRDGKLANWHIRLDEYIHDAVRNSDSTYREALMPGATPAARVNLRNVATGEEKQGWVSAGNMSQLYMVLNIDEQLAMVMTKAEPKRFVSDINVFTEDSKSTHYLLEVNNPLRIGSWTLYQYGYDNEAGRMSAYSSIELVYDPWLIPVYAGLILMMVGSVCMLWGGNRKKQKDQYDVE